MAHISPHPHQQEELLRRAFSALENNDSEATVRALNGVLSGRTCSFAREPLQNIINGIETADWDEVGRDYSQKKFISDTGEFLLIAPLSVRRNGRIETQVSGITGEVDRDIDCALMNARTEIADWFAYRGYLTFPLGEKIGEILPVHSTLRCGAIGEEGGEAFLVPDAWRMPHARNGAALLDLTEQAVRFATKGKHCIERIFEPSSAALLIDAVAGPQADFVRALEYSLHDAGHSTGTGLREKVRSRFFKTLEEKSSEEFHATGMEFWAIDQIVSMEPESFKLPFHPGKLIASSFCTLFGMDAHRAGGFERDVDVRATLKIFSALLEDADSGLLVRNGKLAFQDVSYEGLLRTIRPFADKAWNLVERENIEGVSVAQLQELYRSVGFSERACDIFLRSVVTPCRGIYSELR